MDDKHDKYAEEKATGTVTGTADYTEDAADPQYQQHSSTPHEIVADERGRLIDPEMERARRKGTWKLDVRGESLRGCIQGRHKAWYGARRLTMRLAVSVCWCMLASSPATAVPPLLLLWLANFIDRTNIGNARIAGLEKDLGLKGLQFNTALAIFYVFYIVAEIPSNLILKRLGGNVWLPAIVMAWGLVTTLSGLAKNYAGLLVLRAFLGFLEGGLLPGFAYYLSTLYPRSGIQKRIAFFYAGASLAGAFSGLLSYALTHVTTAVPPLYKWSWIFIAEGIITVGFGVLAAFVMPRSVQHCKALTEEERAACIAAMHEPQQTMPGKASAVERGVPPEGPATNEKLPVHGPEEEAHEWGEVFRAFKDVQVWLTGIAYLGLCNSLYSFTLFLPTILAGLYPDSDQAHIQLLTVPPVSRGDGAAANESLRTVTDTAIPFLAPVRPSHRHGASCRLLCGSLASPRALHPHPAPHLHDRVRHAHRQP